MDTLARSIQYYVCEREKREPGKDCTSSTVTTIILTSCTITPRYFVGIKPVAGMGQLSRLFNPSLPSQNYKLHVLYMCM